MNNISTPSRDNYTDIGKPAGAKRVGEQVRACVETTIHVNAITVNGLLVGKAGWRKQSVVLR